MFSRPNNKTVTFILILALPTLLLHGCYKQKATYSREKVDVFPEMYQLFNNSIAVMSPAGVYGGEMLWHFLSKGLYNSGYYTPPSDYVRQLVLQSGTDGDILWERRMDANPQLKTLLGSDIALYSNLSSFNIVGAYLDAQFTIELRHVSTGYLLAKVKCKASVYPYICFESCNTSKAVKDADGNTKYVDDKDCIEKKKRCDAVSECNRRAVIANADYYLSNNISTAVSQAFAYIPKGPFSHDYLFDAHQTITIHIGEVDDGIDYSYLSSEEFMDNVEAVSSQEIAVCR